MKRIHKVKTAIIVKETIPDEKVEILRDNCNNLRDRAMIDFLLSTGTIESIESILKFTLQLIIYVF